MTTIHKSIEIDVPPGQVMEGLTDPNRRIEYGTGVTSMDEVQDVEGITGGSFHVTYSATCVPFHLRFDVNDKNASRMLEHLKMIAEAQPAPQPS